MDNEENYVDVVRIFYFNGVEIVHKLLYLDDFIENFNDFEQDPSDPSIFLISYAKKEFESEKMKGWYTSPRIFIKGVVLNLNHLVAFYSIYGVTEKVVNKKIGSLVLSGVSHVIFMISKRNNNLVILPFDIENDKCHTMLSVITNENGTLDPQNIEDIFKSGVLLI